MELDGVVLKSLKSLRTLRLEGNMLETVPTEALLSIPSLEALWVGHNIYNWHKIIIYIIITKKHIKNNCHGFTYIHYNKMSGVLYT